jgi:predicted HTH transcriptional regulator
MNSSMGYKPNRRKFMPRKKEEVREVASRYMKKNRNTTVKELMDIFNISERTAYRAMSDALKPLPLNLWDTIEKEIEGLDWQYNPEKEIQGIEIPRYN